jgi:hypothetical protein
VLPVSVVQSPRPMVTQSPRPPETAGGSKENRETPSTTNPNFHIKVVVLLFLCLQNAGHALVARYSQVST